jgi:hypothetical protein
VREIHVIVYAISKWRTSLAYTRIIIKIDYKGIKFMLGKLLNTRFQLEKNIKLLSLKIELFIRGF